MNEFRKCRWCGRVYILSVRDDGGGKQPGYCPDCYLLVKSGLKRAHLVRSRVVLRVKPRRR